MLLVERETDLQNLSQIGSFFKGFHSVVVLYFLPRLELGADIG